MKNAARILCLLWLTAFLAWGGKIGETVPVLQKNCVVRRQEQVGAVSEPDRIIYLTFDDGPGPYTRRLLEILDKYQVKATFFLTENEYSPLIREISEAGHTAAIHSACHNYRKIYASQQAYFTDLYRMQEIIEAHTGTAPKLLRFPGGSSNTVSSFNPGIMTALSKAVTEKGFTYIDWNVDSNDAGGAATSEEVYRNVIRGIREHPVSVVLQHDVRKFSVDAVERIIQWGLQNGYTFLPLDQSSPVCHHPIQN